MDEQPFLPLSGAGLVKAGECAVFREDVNLAEGRADVCGDRFPLILVDVEDRDLCAVGTQGFHRGKAKA